LLPKACKIQQSGRDRLPEPARNTPTPGSGQVRKTGGLAAIAQTGAATPMAAGPATTQWRRIRRDYSRTKNTWPETTKLHYIHDGDDHSAGASFQQRAGDLPHARRKNAGS